MKKLIPFIIIILSLCFLNSCVKANDSVAHDGRCTGSANCSACSNCSGCAHCNSGGSCGVCRGGSSGRSFSSSGSSKKTKAKKHKDSEVSKPQASKPPKVFIDDVNIRGNSPKYVAGISTTNIYEKPSKDSKIITAVPKNTKLIQLSKTGAWYRVRIKTTEKTGYVFYKDVK